MKSLGRNNSKASHLVEYFAFLVAFLGKNFPQSLPKRYETGLKRNNEIAMKYCHVRNEIDPKKLMK